MKKIFTLFAMVLAFATSGNAKQVLEGSFGPWGETCVVEGNTVTFTKAWSGCGWWLNYINLSDYDCIVVKFAEPTVGNINICAQYGDPTGSVDEDGNPTYAINEAYSTNGVITEGSTIAKVDLNIEHSDLVAQFWIQGTVDNAKCVVSEVYVGTEEEYEADKNAAPKLDYKEVSIAALGSGWGDSTYDSATHTITIGDDWTGKGWWLGGVDYSDFDYFVVEFATATPASGKVMVEAGSASSGDDGLFDEACLVKVTPLVEPKNDTKQFYIQGPAGSQYVLAKAYVCTQDYINNNGIADKYASGSDTDVATFEEITLAAESYINGAGMEGEATTDAWGSAVTKVLLKSGGFTFTTLYNAAWGSWSGYAISNQTSTEFNSYDDQYHSCVGSGYNGSSNYAVAFPSAYGETVEVDDPAGKELTGFYVTNTANNVKAYTEGDGMTPGAFTTGDWCLLTINATLADDSKATTSVYLADYRSSVESEHYYIDRWQWVSLAELGQVKNLTFEITSSRANDWGMTTPGYFCMDNLNGEPDETAGISRPATINQTGATRYYSIDGRMQTELSRGLNIIRMSDGTTRKVMVK